MGKKYELVAESMRRLGLRTVEEWQSIADADVLDHANNKRYEELARTPGLDALRRAMALETAQQHPPGDGHQDRRPG